jgi:hypothetical protein
MQWSTIIFALALPIISTTHAMPQTQALPTGIVTLAGMRDHVRPLLIFAPKPDDPQLEIQMRRIHDSAAALTERDVVVVAVPYNSPSTTAAMFTDEDAQAARRRFNVAPGDFVVILIGKDGGEKLRAQKPFSIEKLKDTIDSMPMRQDEMKSRPPQH